MRVKRARRRRTAEGKYSSETLIAAFNANSYIGKIPWVIIILAVERMCNRESAACDKKGVMPFCGVWDGTRMVNLIIKNKGIKCKQM